MKHIIAILAASILAVVLGAAFASNAQGNGKQQTSKWSQATQQQPADPQNACSAKYPSFSQLDTRHKDYLTKTEVRRVPNLKYDFKKADKNHNGKLSQSEYADWVASQCNNMLRQQAKGQMTPPPI